MVLLALGYRGLLIEVMAINIVCTSKPCDGLLFYSYEYCSLLNSMDIESRLIIVCHRRFKPQDYLDIISSKYIHCKNIEFDDFEPSKNDVTLIMGRSMMTLAYLDFRSYRPEQQRSLFSLFKDKLIAVYSENHPVKYQEALDYFSPIQVMDICDREVYPNGAGDHFEKRINFSIYKPPVENIKFKFLFLGTNKNYYQAVEPYLWLYPDHGILTYDDDFIDPKNNNLIVPVDNLIGSFETFVYTKKTFDPAPRIIQECKYFGKNLIYSRDPSIKDGGRVYWTRPISPPDVTPILKAKESMKDPHWIKNIYSTVRGHL